MTTVEFRLDEASLDLEEDPASVDAAVLGETCFIMPVRLCVNGVELLELRRHEERDVFIVQPGGEAQRTSVSDEESSWLPLPLLGFATGALEKLNALKPGGTQRLYLAGGGDLVVTRHGDQISIDSSINDETATTHFIELRDAFGAFCEKVRRLLLSRVPAIHKHPFWSQWFPEKQD